jgi:hypothetical protein
MPDHSRERFFTAPESNRGERNMALCMVILGLWEAAWPWKPISWSSRQTVIVLKLQPRTDNCYALQHSVVPFCEFVWPTTLRPFYGQWKLHGCVLNFIHLSATGVAEIAKSTNMKGCPHTFVYIVYVLPVLPVFRYATSVYTILTLALDVVGKVT